MGIPITYFRSSSYNNWDNCQMQYFLHYTLGMDNPATKAATLGNCVHKALECLAARKKCEQESSHTFVDDIFGIVDIKDCVPDKLIRASFDWHLKNFEHNWKDVKDFDFCEKLLWRALEFDNGKYNPLNRNVIVPEQYFDFEIQKPWAQYEYKIGRKKLKGYLSIKGSMDLITEIQPGIYEIIDWKTGKRSDFAKNKKKEFTDLCNDPQLRIYHYAAHHIFPDIKEIIMTIFFIREEEGGPFTIPLSIEDLPETEQMLEKQFNHIRRTVKPSLNPGPPWSSRPNKYTNWKCSSLCSFANQSKINPKKTVCQYFRDEIMKIGIDKIVNKHIDVTELSTYKSGGGKYDKKEG
jgi:hypothetical protein